LRRSFVDGSFLGGSTNSNRRLPRLDSLPQLVDAFPLYHPQISPQICIVQIRRLRDRDKLASKLTGGNVYVERVYGWDPGKRNLHQSASFCVLRWLGFHWKLALRKQTPCDQRHARMSLWATANLLCARLASSLCATSVLLAIIHSGRPASFASSNPDLAGVSVLKWRFSGQPRLTIVF
jgi:hypothetical protein